MRGLFSLISQIPFIGKHKTILGGVLVAVDAVDKVSGLGVVPEVVGTLGQAWLGFGLADKGRKNRGRQGQV